MRSLLFVATVLLCLCATRSAQAQYEGGLAVISLEISGDGPPELRQQLSARIAEGLAVEGAAVLSLEQSLAALKDTPELIGCSSSECLDRITELMAARHFVRAIVTASGANYELTLELLSPSEDQTLRSTVEQSCNVCTIAELNDLTKSAASALLKPNTEQPMAVLIATDPPGAMITIDGRDAGRSPVKTSLKPGAHDIVATLAGRTGSEKSIEVMSGSSEDQRFELLLASEVGESPKSTTDFGLMKWGVVGGSGALLVLGTVLVAIDGDPTCDSSTRQCAKLNNTLLGGVLSISGGVLAGAGAAWMFWREGQSHEKQGLSFELSGRSALGRYGFLF